MMAQTLRGTCVRLVIAVFAIAGVAAQAADVGGPVKGQLYAIPSATFMGEDADADLDSHVAPGIGLGAQLTDRWALELQYTDAEADVTSALVGASDADVTSQRLDAIFDFGRLLNSDWRIHGVGGLGRIDYDFDSGDEQENDFFNLGLGLSTAITERLSIRGDARLFVLNDESSEAIPATNVALKYVVAGPVTELSGDADGDGVRDRDDQCPTTAPGVNADAQGCALDSDRDGVPNASDACPRTPAGVSVDSRGCALDSDRDGVPDHLDACPDTPRGDEVDARGCTIEEEVVSERIELNLEFDFDSDDLRTSHFPQIDRVAAFMEKYPKTSAQLEGHTDSRGTDAYNQALSERRAYAVRDYLIDKKDIDPRRVTAVGYGESKPTATNDTDTGRQRNRRVDAVIETREMSVRPRRED